MAFVLTEDEKPTLDDVIEHYGVKGMKWGVRRSDAQLARSRGSSESTSSDRKAKAKKVAKVAGAVVTAGAVSVGTYYVGKYMGDKGKYTMDQMNHYAAQHAGRTAAMFVKNNIDFEVSMAHVRNIERGYRNDMIPGAIKDRRKEKRV